MDKQRKTSLKTLLFYWGNIGPIHNDRLQALVAALEKDWQIIVVERAAKSSVYDWDNAAQSDYTVTTLFTHMTSARNLVFMGRLWQAIRQAKPHAVFFCDYQLWPVMANAWWLRLTGRAPFIMLDSKFDDFPRSVFRELMKKIFLLPYRGGITASFRSRDYLRFHGFSEKNLELGYDTLSVDRIRSLAGKTTLTSSVAFGDRDFVVVARLVPKKNLDLALEAYRRWRDLTGGNRKLHLCGSGPLEGALRTKCVELGIVDQVVFHGFLQSDGISQILARSLCLLLPSKEEQFGLVVNEALAVGLPVVVSTNAGASDILVRPGVNGFLCQPADPDCWAALMALLSQDETRWRAMAHAAYEDAPRGDVTQFVEGVLRLVGLPLR